MECNFLLEMSISAQDVKLKFEHNEFDKKAVTISRLQSVFKRGHMNKLRKSLANFIDHRVSQM